MCNNILSINTRIDGIIVDNSDNIINVLINNNYISIKPTKNNTKLTIQGMTDLRIIDSIIQPNNDVDDRFIFNNFFSFESTLNQLYNNTIISHLKNKEFVLKHKEVSNIDDYSINSVYRLSEYNVSIKGKSYSVYFKNDNGIYGIIYKKIKLKSPDSELYPNWGKIYIKYNYYEEIKKITI